MPAWSLALTLAAAALVVVALVAHRRRER